MELGPYYSKDEPTVSPCVRLIKEMFCMRAWSQGMLPQTPYPNPHQSQFVEVGLCGRIVYL